MNPKDFDWDESQQVTVTNPTNKDYSFKVHSKDYSVGAGETVKMPGFIAWVYVYGLACRMAQENNIKKDENGNKSSDFQHWNEEGFRKQYYDQIVVDVDDVIEQVKPEPQIETVTPPAEVSQKRTVKA